MSRESGQYPVRYRAGAKARVSTAIGMAVMALLAIGLFGAAMFTDIIWIRILFGAFGTLFVVGCGWVILDIFTHETMFLRDEVIVSNFRGDRRFARADLFAWNWGQKCADLQEVELYREGAKMPFRVRVIVPVNAAVQAWFGDVTSLEWRERSSALDETEADAAFGNTPQDRVRNAIGEARIAAWISLAALAPAAWAFFFPAPYRFAVGAAIATPVMIALLTILRRDRWKFERGERDPRPATGWVIFTFAMVLTLRAFLDWEIIDWAKLAVFSIAAGALIGVGLRTALAETSRDPMSVAAWALTATFLVYGAVTPLNMWLDRTPPESYRAVVLETYSESLRVSPWGPYDAPQEHDASARLLERVEEGGPICADLYRGAFGIRSFDLKPCPAQ